jgi:hypothetical protein
VFDEHVELLKGAFIEENVQPLARGELALGVLSRGASRAAAGNGSGAPLRKLFEDMLHGDSAEVIEKG